MVSFFTVIIPTYQRPEELHRAVNSVLSQTFNDFELIIVNNAKNEITPFVNDKRIKILSEERKGANFARNTGIENAQGEFICFLDDDDVYLNNHLETLRQLILVHAKKVAMYRTFTKLETADRQITDQPVVLRNPSQSVLDHIYTVLLFMACVCCHKDILSKIKFDPSVPIAQDYHLWTRILVEYPLIEAPVITTLYHRSANSISSPGLINYQNYIFVFKNLFLMDPVRKQLNKKIRDMRVFRYYYLILNSCTSELTLRQFFKFSSGALIYNPSYIFSFKYLKLAIKYVLIRIHLL